MEGIVKLYRLSHEEARNKLRQIAANDTAIRGNIRVSLHEAAKEIELALGALYEAKMSLAVSGKTDLYDIARHLDEETEDLWNAVLQELEKGENPK